MRVEPYSVGSYLHVVKRGARGADIVRDENDKWRFLRSLYFMNDEFFDKNWVFSTKGQSMFYRPTGWPEQKRLVAIVAYTLMPNHFHLILREIKEGGVSMFMKKLGQSMTNHTNEKYNETGSLFQGSFRSKTCTDDGYFRYLSAYVMVKNTFELFPGGGIQAARRDFDHVWDWAITYPFSSLRGFVSLQNNPIVTDSLLAEIYSPEQFKNFSRDVILSGKWQKEETLFE